MSYNFHVVLLWCFGGVVAWIIGLISQRTLPDPKPEVLELALKKNFIIPLEKIPNLVRTLCAIPRQRKFTDPYSLHFQIPGILFVICSPIGGLAQDKFMMESSIVIGIALSTVITTMLIRHWSQKKI